MPLVIVGAAIALIAWAILRYPAAPAPRPPATPAPIPSRPAAPTSPKQVVQAYLKALDAGDYQAAHALLTAESRRAYPLERFAELCRRPDRPALDPAGAVEQKGDRGEMVVLVPMVEDTAAASFVMAREQDAWRIVFRTGSPWFPYP